MLIQGVVNQISRLVANHKVDKPVDIEALAELLRFIKQENYCFTAITPVTHQHVLKRQPILGATLRDIFGWNKPFVLHDLPSKLRTIMIDSDLLRPVGLLVKSAVRIASLDEDIFVHSSFPTTQEDAVFFGPDTYRFARFIRQELNIASLSNVRAMRHSDNPYRILDVGCGSGAGGIVAAKILSKLGAIEVTMTDINPVALAYTAANAQTSGIPVNLMLGDALGPAKGKFDLIISNPPYLDDTAGRAYRDGGEGLGRALSLRIATEAIAHLAVGGTLLLYTGVAMVDDTDPFINDLMPLLIASGFDWSYEEIDPDIFGEELERSAYAQAHRIAAVGLVVTHP